MKKNLIHTLIAPALLLAALALGMTGCERMLDATPDAEPSTDPNFSAGQPLYITVASKPGFTALDPDGATSPDAGTRSSVDPGTGTFGWTDGDVIYLTFAFDTAPNSAIMQTWKYTPGTPAAGNCPPNWTATDDWTTDASGAPATALTWPTGATSVEVKAFCTDNKRSNISFPTGIILYVFSGTCDHMLYSGSFSTGSEISIELKHVTTRLVFTGLKPGDDYRFATTAGDYEYPSIFSLSSFDLDYSYSTLVPRDFTADAAGTVVMCANMNGLIDLGNGEVAITLKQAGGTTIGTTRIKGIDTGSWTMNGRMYTIHTAEGSGPITPDQKPDLIN